MELKTLFDLLDTRPFRTFEIDLISGCKIRVDHPEFVFIIPGRHRVSHIEVYHPESEEVDFTWADGIAGLHVVPKNGE